MNTFPLFTLSCHHTALNRVPSLLLLLSALFSLSACISNTHAERQPIDCALPHVDKPLASCSRVRQASEFSGCLSAADISEHTCLVRDTDVSFCSATDSLRFVDDRSLSGISVQNCTLRGTRHRGIRATRFFGGELGPDIASPTSSESHSQMPANESPWITGPRSGNVGATSRY